MSNQMPRQAVESALAEALETRRIVKERLEKVSNTEELLDLTGYLADVNAAVRNMRELLNPLR